MHTHEHTIHRTMSDRAIRRIQVTLGHCVEVNTVAGQYSTEEERKKWNKLNTVDEKQVGTINVIYGNSESILLDSWSDSY